MNHTHKIKVTLVFLSIFTSIVSGYQNSNQENPRGHQGPPPEAFSACTGKNVGDTSQFTSPRGDIVSGTCELTRDSQEAKLVLRPEHNRRSSGQSTQNNQMQKIQIQRFQPQNQNR